MPVQRTPGAVSTRREGGRAALAPCRGKTIFVKVGEEVGCDLTPPQNLVVIFTVKRGGDAALEQTNEECLDMGGTPSWENGRRLFCRNVDY